MDRQTIRRFLDISHRVTRPHHTMDMLLPRAEFFVLNVLYDRQYKDGKDTSVAKLAMVMDKTTQATSKLLTIMEGKGYLNRKTSENDRRVVLVTLSPEGKSIIESSREEACVNCERLFGQLGTEDAENLVRITEKIYNIIQSDRKSGKQIEDTI